MSVIITVADSLPFDLLCAFIWFNLGGHKFDSQAESSQADSKKKNNNGKSLTRAEELRKDYHWQIF